MLGAAYYALLGARLAALRPDSTPSGAPSWPTLAVELMRCLVLASVVAVLMVRTRIDTWTGGLILGLVLWVGFPLVLWVGALVGLRS